MIFTGNRRGCAGFLQLIMGRGNECKEVCLQLLRNIGALETFEEYTTAVNKLKEHKIWSLPKSSGF